MKTEKSYKRCFLPSSSGRTLAVMAKTKDWDSPADGVAEAPQSGAVAAGRHQGSQQRSVQPVHSPCCPQVHCPGAHGHQPDQRKKEQEWRASCASTWARLKPSWSGNNRKKYPTHTQFI